MRVNWIGKHLSFTALFMRSDRPSNNWRVDPQETEPAIMALVQKHHIDASTHGTTVAVADVHSKEVQTNIVVKEVTTKRGRTLVQCVWQCLTA